jgi:hypothetical protein
MSNKVKLEHINLVIDSIRDGYSIIPKHCFSMSDWGHETACGTSACLWGTAYVYVYGKTTAQGPPDEWDVGPKTKLIRNIMYAPRLLAKHVVSLFDAISEDGTYYDLSGADMTNALLHNLDLSRSVCVGTVFDWASLAYTDLTMADLRDASLVRVSFTCANLSYANLSYANLSHASMDTATLYKADLRNATLVNTALPYADLRKVRYEGAHIGDIDTSNSVMHGSDMNNLLAAKLGEK